MKTNRKMLTAALTLSAVAAFGCDATQFNQVNEQFKEIKTTSTTLKSSTLPAAAMATSLAAVEIMNAIASDTETKANSGAQMGNVIAPGAGNVIAPGGLNYLLLQAPETTSTLDDAKGLGTLVSKRGSKTILNVNFGYSREKTDNGFKFDLVSLKGDTNGFAVDAKGGYEFAYTGENVGGKKVAELKASISGDMKTKSGAYKLDNLSFQFKHPRSDAGKVQIGHVKMSDKNGAMECFVHMAGSTVTAEGTMKDAKGNVLYSMTMDENGVKAEEGGEQ